MNLCQRIRKNLHVRMVDNSFSYPPFCFQLLINLIPVSFHPQVNVPTLASQRIWIKPSHALSFQHTTAQAQLPKDIRYLFTSYIQQSISRLQRHPLSNPLYQELWFGFSQRYYLLHARKQNTNKRLPLSLLIKQSPIRFRQSAREPITFAQRYQYEFLKRRHYFILLLASEISKPLSDSSKLTIW